MPRCMGSATTSVNPPIYFENFLPSRLAALYTYARRTIGKYALLFSAAILLPAITYVIVNPPTFCSVVSS